MAYGLLRGARWRANPTRAYYLLTVGWGVFYSMAFTLALVYQIQVAHLTPLQLVVVGTVLELTCFLGEIPTGVVADGSTATSTRLRGPPCCR
jgi:hypothetical protein